MCQAVIRWDGEPGPALSSLRETVAELLACVGPEVATNLVIQFHTGS